jgi:hypothetical protein
MQEAFSYNDDARSSRSPLAIYYWLSKELKSFQEFRIKITRTETFVLH